MEYVKIFHLFFLFPYFAMLTQPIQLHHGFNSTINTTKQNSNVHLLHAPSKLRLTPWKYHNINSCKQLFKKITKIQTSSMMYLWPYYYLKLFPHKTLVIISAHEKHFHCSTSHYKCYLKWCLPTGKPISHWCRKSYGILWFRSCEF
jgi:hypothetical protein